MFDYPPKVEESADKKPEEFATAVLSTTAKAQQRAKRAEKERAAKEAEAAAKEGGDAMETEPTASTPATPGPTAAEKMDVDEDKEEKKEDGNDEKKEGESDKKKRAEKEKAGYELNNLTRVLPEQLKYISFLEDGRYEPVKKVCFDPPSLSLIKTNIFFSFFLCCPSQLEESCYY